MVLDDTWAQNYANATGSPVTSQTTGTVFYPTGSTQAGTGSGSAVTAVLPAPAPTPTGSAEEKRRADERARFAGATFFDTDPGAPWYQGAGFYEAVPTPAWYMGPDSGELAPDPYAFLGSEQPEGLREGQIGGIARVTPGNPFSMGEADYLAPQNFAMSGALQDILNQRGESLWDFGNIYAAAGRDLGHGFGDVRQYGVSPEELAYLTKQYGGAGLFGLGTGMENPYLQMTVRGDLPGHALAGGGYLTTAQDMYDYFSQMPGALDDPAVQEYLGALIAGQQEAAPHEKAFREANAKRQGYSRMAAAMLAAAPLGAALGGAMAAGNLAQGIQGLTLGQQIGLGAAGGMAKTGLQGGEFGDILKAGLMGGAGGAASGMLGGAGAEFASPEISGLAEQTGLTGGDYFGDLGLGGYAPDQIQTMPGLDTDLSAMFPDPTVAQLAEAGFSMDPSELARLDPAVAAKYAAAMETAIDTETGLLTSPDFEMLTDTGFQASLAGLPGATPTDLGGYSPEQIEGTTAPEQVEPGMSAQDAAGYAQKAYKAYGLVKQLLGGDEGEMPAREEGQSDADYYQDIAVDYLGLDVDAMAEAGLEPGTPEYLDYILAQADSIIEQIFGADPSALDELESIDDLKAALRGKTQQEMQQLARALNVRGQLGQMASAEQAINPFTGETEELGGGFRGQTGVAAAQRGRAREIEQLAGLRGSEARGMLGGLLGRNADIFGLRASMNARKIQEMMESMSQEDEERQRRYRGLAAAPGAGAEWMTEFESLGDPAIQQLLAGLGGDEEESRAALAALFGLEG